MNTTHTSEVLFNKQKKSSPGKANKQRTYYCQLFFNKSDTSEASIFFFLVISQCIFKRNKSKHVYHYLPLYLLNIDGNIRSKKYIN